MTPEHMALARSFARRWGSFSDPVEAESLAVRAVWMATQTWVEGKGCAFSTWASWYARSYLGRHRQQQARHWGHIAGVDPEWLGVEPPEPTDVKALRQAIAKLPPTQREAVELVCLQGMTQSDVAARSGSTRQAVAKRIDAAMKKLKRTLQERERAPF